MIQILDKRARLSTLYEIGLKGQEKRGRTAGGYSNQLSGIYLPYGMYRCLSKWTSDKETFQMVVWPQELKWSLSILYYMQYSSSLPFHEYHEGMDAKLISKATCTFQIASCSGKHRITVF